MIVRIEMEPRRVKRAAAFTAADPLAPGMPVVPFTLEAYRFVVKGSGTVRETGGPYLYALVPGDGGPPRFLPEALGRLWEEGSVPAEALPALVHGGPATRTSDFALYYPRWRVLRIMAAIGWALAAVGILLLGLNLPAAERARAHAVHEMTAEAWLARPPVVEESLRVNELPIAGRMPLVDQPRMPDGIMAVQPLTQAAWTVAADGRARLILLSEATARAPGPRVFLMGVTLRCTDLGIPPAVLDAVAARVPGLDREMATVDLWMWRDAYGSGGWFVPILLLMPAVVMTVALLVVWPGMRRRRRQRAEILARYAAMRGPA